MSDIANNETAEVLEKPVKENEASQFPPFPEPTDNDFDEDIPEEERTFYKNKFQDLNTITSVRLHCSACDRHLGCSVRNESRMRTHPMLRTLVCHTCHTFYNSGEFEKGDDGSELYCRWCGQGGQVYCCSDCAHVFCAKCIKRNLGPAKIKEIEQLEDWKCFKCNNKCLWDLRAICWAVLRYCDLKSKITHGTQDTVLKAAYQKNCAQDQSECCKNKFRRKEKDSKKKETETPTKSKSTASVISKIPPTIQVKKFASINMEDSPKPEKKAQKRAASPKNKAIFIKNPIAISNKLVNHMGMQPLPKKIRMPHSPVINPVRFNNDRKIQSYNAYSPRIRPKNLQTITPMSIMFNGYSNTGTFTNDNINLSLESLTQGLDMSAMAGMQGSTMNDDVVCTPDFPLEPLCEVTEDNGDDDVQCITPGPVAAPKAVPPVVIRSANTLPDLSPENIVQMTDNDVTVNATTGGLKFRVDPQTLSSNKMYRLPDGRIFAINANPNMPGGYSATIVAVTDNNSGKTPKGTTFAAKLSAVSSQATTSPLPKYSSPALRRNSNKRSTPKPSKVNRGVETPSRIADMNVPVEWYRYNLIDAIDAMEYSLTRLHQLKKDATTLHLRTRSVTEMRNMHRALDRSLNTSVFRFKEIRDNLNKEFKQYLAKKTSDNISDDDDVEILQEEDDDPIFIDENSSESNVNESQEVDLTVVGSSDLNDSNEQSVDKNDPLITEPESLLNQSCNDLDITDKNNEIQDNHSETENVSLVHTEEAVSTVNSEEKYEVTANSEDKTEEKQGEEENSSMSIDESLQNGESQKEILKENSEENNGENKIQPKLEQNDEIQKDIKLEDDILNDNAASFENDKKVQDTEMSDELIESLLKDDNTSNCDDAQKTLFEDN